MPDHKSTSSVKNHLSFKSVFVKGITLALPVGVILYIFIKMIGIFHQVIEPLAKKLGIERLLGELTFIVIDILAIILLILILGLFMQLKSIAKFGQNMEETVIKVIPSLNYLKMMAAEKLALEDTQVQWKPVLLHKRGNYFPAYIIEEKADFITWCYTKVPGTEPNFLVISPKNDISYTPITLKEMESYNSKFGKGYIDLILSNK